MFAESTVRAMISIREHELALTALAEQLLLLPHSRTLDCLWPSGPPFLITGSGTRAVLQGAELSLRACECQYSWVPAAEHHSMARGAPPQAPGSQHRPAQSKAHLQRRLWR